MTKQTHVLVSSLRLKLIASDVENALFGSTKLKSMKTLRLGWELNLHHGRNVFDLQTVTQINAGQDHRAQLRWIMSAQKVVNDFLFKLFPIIK